MQRAEVGKEEEGNEIKCFTNTQMCGVDQASPSLEHIAPARLVS